MKAEDAYNNINLKELEAFLAVAETLSFSKAANKLKMSQPSVSVKIKSLENSFNLVLFKRDGGNVAITADGQRLLAPVRELFYSLRKVINTMNTAPKENTIRITVSEAIFLYSFQSMLEEYRRLCQNVQYQTVIGNAITNVERLENNESDLALAGWVAKERPKSGKLKVERIGYDELVLIVPVQHPLAYQNKVSIKTVKKYPYVGRKPNSGVQRTVTQIFKLMGVNTNEVQTVAVFDDASSVIMAVYRDLGISIVSKLQAATAEKIGLIKMLKIKEKVSRRPIFAMIRKDAPQNILDFFEFCVSYLRKNLGDPLK